ncbi:hypothetical protein [Carboxylicivirga linearis]|uniref:Phage abortive infection protein n=1 Tax=Carboxylicivirga linearis TaxID=1628157 RepID=A0ABS5K1L0_9BACT|nr:hypothetical protein [Carboxylicivirga linearis]MBS2101031.1 hypothetical protein [Carboxylicivirga linearis]
MKRLRNNFLLILGLFVSIAAIGYIIFQFQIQEIPVNVDTNKPDFLDFYSRLGDAIGGFAGSLLSFASILFVLHTIKIQRYELKEQKKELFNQRKEYIENKTITVIYKEFDRWSKVCENNNIRLEKILQPYLPTVNSFNLKLVNDNYKNINQEINISLLEDYNKICFRLYNILFNDSEEDSEKLTTFLDRAEMRNILYTIGSLFETTRVFGIHDTILCYRQNEKDNSILKAEKEILKSKMNYMVLLNLKIFEYQLDCIPVEKSEFNKRILEIANERLFVFYQMDELSNRIKKINDEIEKPAANNV